jgi:hypothetical protein
VKNNTSYDLAVIGGGSGGFGAALAAARGGLRVLFVERGPMLGGNSTLAGVNTWEPGVGGPGFHGELYDMLARRTNAIGVSRSIHHWTSDQPWGWSRVQPGLDYRLSLHRAGVKPDDLTRVTFEPEAMAAAMRELLEATGNVELRLGTEFTAATVARGQVQSVTLNRSGQTETITAAFFIDATANLALATAAACTTYLGCEPHSMYHEPSAPAEHQERLNGVSICFRATPVATPAVQPLPAGVPDEFRNPSLSITEYPNGDLNLNPLPIMEGIEFHKLGGTEGRRVCEQRVYQFWHWLQKEKGFDRYRLVKLFPFTGVREGPRLIGRYVLTENDIRAGCSGQRDAARWITLADHALDVHGEGHLCRELSEPYGVPYDCLLPKEYSNLAVACRGASFTHIAAASCRLSRTMMHLGQAAGTAAAIAIERGVEFPTVPAAELRTRLRAQHVQVDWPSRLEQAPS